MYKIIDTSTSREFYRGENYNRAAEAFFLIEDAILATNPNFDRTNLCLVNEDTGRAVSVVYDPEKDND